MRSFKLTALSSLFLLSILVIFTLINSGCGSNPTVSGPTPPGGIETLGVLQGTVEAPAGTDLTFWNLSPLERLAEFFISAAEALSGQTPVDGATIEAYNFYTGALVSTTTTDINGFYEFTDLPQGIDVLIVALKSTPTGLVRLSAIVPNVDVQTTVTGSVDASTSLAAEQFAIYLGQNFEVTIGDVQMLIATAEAELGAVPSIDLHVGAGIIPATIGLGLVATAETDSVIAATPSLTDMSVAGAKAMVQDIRDSWLNIERITSNEALKQEQNLENVINPHLLSLEALFMNTSEAQAWFEGKQIYTLLPTIEAYINNVINPYTGTDEAFYLSTFGYYTNTIEAYFSDIENQIRDVMDASAHVGAIASAEYSVTATNAASYVGPTSDGTWVFNLESGKKVTIEVINISTPETGYDDIYISYRFTVTSSSDPSLDYRGFTEGLVAITTLEQLGFPYMGHIDGYLKDSVITDAVTFEIDITQTGSGTPPNYKYATAAMTGIFDSKELKVNGTVNTTAFQDELYPDPSYISIQGQIETPAFSMNGNLTANGFKITTGPSPEVGVSSFAFNGTFTSPRLSIDGSMSGTMFQDENYPLPSSLVSTGTLTTDVISANGSLNSTLVAVTIGGEPVVYPSSFSWNGRIDTAVSTFEGSMSASMSKQVINGSLNYYPASLSIDGRFTPDIIGLANVRTSFTLAEEVINSQTYIYPTSVAIDGITFTSEVVSFDGSMVWDQPVRDVVDSQFDFFLERVVLSGGLSTDFLTIDGDTTINFDANMIEFDVGAWAMGISYESFSVSGTISTGLITIEAADIDATVLDEGRGWPGNVTITDGDITAPNFGFTGDSSVDFVVNGVGSYAALAISDISFTGTYTDRATPETSNTGSYTYSCANAATTNFDYYDPVNFPRTQMNFSGTLASPGYPTTQAIISLDQTQYRKASSNVFFGHGLKTLNGTVYVDRGAATPYMDIDLTNQSGIVTDLLLEYGESDLINLTNVSGTIKASDGTTLATFSFLGGGFIKVTYADGNFETLL
jgi:hypothetical protein